MKEPEKPAEAVEDSETAAEGQEGAPAAATEGDKKEGEEKKAPAEKK